MQASAASRDVEKVISLEGQSLDTSRSSGAGVLARDVGTLAFGAGEATWIVQLSGPVTEADKIRLREAGAKLFGYMPEFAFAARMDEATARRVAALSGVNWIGPYKAEYKIQPKLAAKNSGTVTVDINAFHADDVSAIAEAASKIGAAKIEEIRVGEFGRVHADVPAAVIPTLAAMETVQWIEEFDRPMLFNNRAVEGPRLNVTNVWAVRGLTGSNQIAAVCDTGLDTGNLSTLHTDFAGRVKAAYALGRVGNWSDSNGHGTHVCGSVLGSGAASAGKYRGVAADARLVIQSVMDSGGNLGGIPSSLGALFSPAYTNGARVHSDSWGDTTDSSYNSYSQDVDFFIWSNRDMVICFAAGNQGTDANSDGVVDLSSMRAPATAKNCISVGASENFHNTGEASGLAYSGLSSHPFVNPVLSDLMSKPYDGVNQGMAALSSRGPCRDGRFKPDIVAPGTDIISTRSRSASGTGWGVAPDNTNYMIEGGTSMATPLTAGCAILFRQFFATMTAVTSPSASLIKGMMINGARSISPGQYGTGSTREIPGGQRPNNVEGWGQIDVEHTLFPSVPLSIAAFDDGTLATGATNLYRVSIGGTNLLRVTLCWSDYPGTAGSGTKLVNDLDLVVINPAGATNFTHGMSSPDRSNNVEGIDFMAPTTGVYVIRVAGHNVPSGGSQPYSLLLRGDTMNTAPFLPAFATQTNYELTAIVITNRAIDGDIPANSLSYSLVTAPTGAVIDTNGVITWTPTEVQEPSTNLVTTVVTDNGVPPMSTTNSFTLVVRESNSPPVFPFVPTQTIAELTTFIFTNAATDPDIPTNTLTYSLLSAPTGMTIDSASGVISWTPAEDQGPSTSVITAVATDNGASPLATTGSFVAVVTEVNRAPVLAVVSNMEVFAGASLLVTNRASDADIPTNSLAFSLVVAPDGALLDSVSGLLSWSPSAALYGTTNNFTVRVTDDGAPPLSADVSFNVVVTAPAVNLGGIADGALITWPAAASVYVLEMSTNIFDPASWMTASNAPGTNGVFLIETNGVPADTEFFRLRLP